MFLQPSLLWALPLIALPIIIHLINRSRHRSIPWAAMMFLIEARRMQKSIAKLRHWLIMVARMAAIAALIFAVSRPLASGRLGSLGMGKPDTTLVLLDRSASMESLDLQTGASKRSTALTKLSELLGKRGFGQQLVLIDSAGGEPIVLDSPAALLESPHTAATATQANVADMLQRGLAFLQANETGRADVWICSDLRENDWDVDSGRWATIREQFLEMKGVHHYLLSYADPTADNLSVRVANVNRRLRDKQAELVLDVFVSRTDTHLTRIRSSSGETARDEAGLRVDAASVPVEFDINGIKSVAQIELDSEGGAINGHIIPIDRQLQSGWGTVSLPADSNSLDNRFYFVFSQPPVRKATIVTDDNRVGQAFRLNLSIPSEDGVKHEAIVLPSNRIGELTWEDNSLLIWQADMPSGFVAEQMQRFVESGRVVFFFPPKDAAWSQLQGDDRTISSWRGDADILANVDSGEALPLDQTRVYQYAPSLPQKASRSARESSTLREKANAATAEVQASGVSSWIENRTPLAGLANNQPLLSRAATDAGSVYFCCTLPTPQYSSLERDAVAFYVMLQRALSAGSLSLSPVASRAAGREALVDRSDWKRVAPTEGTVLSDYGLDAGVFSAADNWVALNRSSAEDVWTTANIEEVDALFEGLAYERIDDAIGNTTSLASEIWRWFLIAMLLALLVEAVLCLPDRMKLDSVTGDSQPMQRAVA